MRTIAARIRRSIRAAEGLTCSIGVAPNKFLAKLASEAAKPRATPRGPVEGSGVAVVEPGRELEFLHPLPVSALWGVGPATLRKLQRLGVATVGDLAALPVEAVVASLGPASGAHLHALSHALDDRPVVPDVEAKSISHEETFARDLTDPDALRAEVIRQADAVADRLRNLGRRGRTVQIKVRFPDFETVTRSHTFPGATDRPIDLFTQAWVMLEQLPIERGIRLIGVGVSNLEPARFGGQQSRQQSLVEQPENDDWDAAYDAVAAIRTRFGRRSIRPARTLGRDDRPGDAPWGPSAPEP